MRSLTYTTTVGRLRKRIEFKDHTIKRLRDQRNILRRAAQAPVKGTQESHKERDELRESSPILVRNSYTIC